MKKSKFILLLVVLLLVSAATAFILASVIDRKSEVDDEIQKDYGDYKDPTESDDKDKDKSDGRSPFSGVEATKSELSKRPVAVMFDNHPRARWQAGLSQAEIVYEFPVENPYTRYIGIFLVNSPESLGPIRSTRPYLVETVAAYDPVYVRCGGSEAGKTAVLRYKIRDLDCLERSEAFKRTSDKKSPNNLYTSMEKVRSEQKKLNYSDGGNYEGYKFYKKDTDLGGDSAETINIKYNKENTTRYEYNKSDKVYERFKDGKQHIDEIDEKKIKAKNIIIQEVKSKVIDSEGRREIGIIGSGKAKLISNGTVVDITWRKPSAEKKISYFNGSSEVELNEGTTWVQIVEEDTSTVIE